LAATIVGVPLADRTRYNRPSFAGEAGFRRSAVHPLPLRAVSIFPPDPQLIKFILIEQDIDRLHVVVEILAGIQPAASEYSHARRRSCRFLSGQHRRGRSQPAQSDSRGGEECIDERRGAAVVPVSSDAARRFAALDEMHLDLRISLIRSMR